uniref:hypothetical protein n=1 Tax=Staphylococcus aureus TaxID=1280 RepID=UPI00301C9D67
SGATPPPSGQGQGPAARRERSTEEVLAEHNRLLARQGRDRAEAGQSSTRGMKPLSQLLQGAPRPEEPES